MESTLSTINLLPTSREQVEMFAEKTINEVKSGNENALNLKIKLSAIKKAIEIIEEGIKDYSLHEAMKFSTKQFETNGAKIEIADNLGTKYDFTNCGDVLWTEADKVKKEREKFLKSLTKTISVNDDETGEVLSIHPPKKKSSIGLKITLI